MADARVTPSTLYTAFEIRNETAREIYVGMTELVFSVFMVRIKADPPWAIRHWKSGDIMNYHSVEFGLQRNSAKAFLASHIQALSGRGWRVIAEPMPGTAALESP